MPEFPPPGIAQDASDRAASALTPDAVALVLADFRDWLTALRTPPPPPSPTRGEGVPFAPSPLVGEGGGGGETPIDLHTLLGQFLAVRQEINLQTRAVRAQQEQNAETLRQLALALDSLR